MDEDISITDWVSRIRDRRPELPDRLTLEIERDRLEKLSNWRERVAQLREAYEEMEEEEIPDEIEDLAGGKVVVPAMMAMDDMTEEEVDAWHDLFACVAPQMAKIAHKYWRAHSGDDSTLVLADVLDYLPIVFLYVLSNYDEDRSGEGDRTFAAEEDRTRLTTWITIESRRHIKEYLQSCAYLVGPGSSYLHRLKSQVRRIEREHYAQEGEPPTHDDVKGKIKTQSHYARSVSEEALDRRLREVRSGTTIVSAEDPVENQSSGDNEVQYKNILPAKQDLIDEDLQELASIMEYVKSRTDDQDRIRACRRVLNSTTPLTIEERYAFQS